MLLWANFSKKDGYYTPYVDKVNEDGTLHGHEMLDNFISFYNDSRTIFANDQKGALAAVDGSVITAASAADGLQGYFIAPIAGKRVLNETTLSAKLSAETDEEITFVLQGKNGTVVLPAELDGKTASAKLDEATLEKLGASIDGTIQLCAGERVLQTISVIFNIEEPVEDPYEVDGFENYYGLDSLLTEKWIGNHAAESGIEVSLNEEKACDGDYAMQFSYQETSDGWAGVTIAKETDWSDCNALSFYTIPDGKNQKTVVQITANNTVYEVYLNQYADYAGDTDGTPLLVTIPFADFCERDTEGNPTGGLAADASAVTSVGLWVNAIAGSDAIGEDGTVAGVIIYDKIVAVSTDVEEASFVLQTQEDNKNTEDDKKDEDSKKEETGKDEAGSKQPDEDKKDKVDNKQPDEDKKDKVDNKLPEEDKKDKVDNKLPEESKKEDFDKKAPAECGGKWFGFRFECENIFGFGEVRIGMRFQKQNMYVFEQRGGSLERRGQDVWTAPQAQRGEREERCISNNRQISGVGFPKR
jgi:mannan endo-1,4-beta-mannosidase